MPNRQRKKPKNAAAVALGRLGGLKRAQTVLEVIPPAKRSMYARHAAATRWARVRAEEKKKEDAKKA